MDLFAPPGQGPPVTPDAGKWEAPLQQPVTPGLQQPVTPDAGKWEAPLHQRGTPDAGKWEAPLQQPAQVTVADVKPTATPLTTPVAPTPPPVAAPPASPPPPPAPEPLPPAEKPVDAVAVDRERRAAARRRGPSANLLTGGVRGALDRIPTSRKLLTGQ